MDVVDLARYLQKYFKEHETDPKVFESHKPVDRGFYAETHQPKEEIENGNLGDDNLLQRPTGNDKERD